MDPGGERGVLQRDRDGAVHVLPLLVGQAEEGGRVDDPAADQGEVGVVVGDPLAHPEQGGGLRLVVPVGDHLGRPEPFHVPGVEDLVGSHRREERGADEAGTPDRDMGALVLERASSAVGGVEQDHRGVILPGSLAEDPGLDRHRRLELVPEEDARCALQLAGRVGRQPVPDAVDLGAVQIEPADEERHVDQIVVAPRPVGARGAVGVHAGDDAPPGRRGDRHPGREIEPDALRIREDVGAVDEEEVGPGPRHRVVEGVGEEVEPDLDRPRRGDPDPPGVVIGLVPGDRLAPARGRERRHLAGVPAHFVGAGGPRRNREQHRRGAGGVEAHRDVHGPMPRARRVEPELVPDVAHRGRCRRGPCGAPLGRGGRGAEEEDHGDDPRLDGAGGAERHGASFRRRLRIPGIQVPHHLAPAARRRGALPHRRRQRPPVPPRRPPACRRSGDRERGRSR